MNFEIIHTADTVKARNPNTLEVEEHTIGTKLSQINMKAQSNQDHRFLHELAMVLQHDRGGKPVELSATLGDKVVTLLIY